jgi:hypothetical protein
VIGHKSNFQNLEMVIPDQVGNPSPDRQALKTVLDSLGDGFPIKSGMTELSFDSAVAKLRQPCKEGI